MDTEHGRAGRPRSEQARTAVLHAVDDLLVDVGYAAMTMKGIAESAGVSRQTVYRWWSTKAEILFEAAAADAAHELAVARADDPLDELTAYLDALTRFLTVSPAGAAYRALVGEAQHDADVARMLSADDVLGDSARVVVERTIGTAWTPPAVDHAVARLVGPTFFRVLAGHPSESIGTRDQARGFLRDVT